MTQLIQLQAHVTCPECGRRLSVPVSAADAVGHLMWVPTHNQPESRDACPGSGTWENAE